MTLLGGFIVNPNDFLMDYILNTDFKYKYGYYEEDMTKEEMIESLKSLAHRHNNQIYNQTYIRQPDGSLLRSDYYALVNEHNKSKIPCRFTYAIKTINIKTGISNKSLTVSSMIVKSTKETMNIILTSDVVFLEDY